MIQQLRGLTRLARAARKGSADPDLGLIERQLLRWLVVLGLVAANRAERYRQRTQTRFGELALARSFLAVASLLASVSRLVIRHRERFAEHLVRSTREVFRTGLTVDTPLAVLGILWQDPRLTLVHTACPNFSYLYLLADRRVRFLVSAYWAKFPVDFLWYRVLRLFAHPLGITERVIWLGNTLEEVAAARRFGLPSEWVNHNCFINEDRFPLMGFPARPRFDAVLNANAGRWKRHDLTRDVQTLAYITYSRDASGRMLWPVHSFTPAYRNETYLDESERQAIYAESCCALVLSACEGSNYATAEFLLSGLPIVSTPSRGGRDVWFTGLNCLLCTPTCEGVSQAVTVWKQRQEAGMVDHARIRRECLASMQEHRERFVAVLDQVLRQEGLESSGHVVFESQRTRDRLLHALSFGKGNVASRHPVCGGIGWYLLSDLPC